MDDLVQWMRAQLDEDERVARAASEYAEADWRLDEDGETVLWWPPEPHIAEKEREKGLPVVSDHWRGQTIESGGTRLAPHIARHDPARVLREIDATRQLLDLHGLVHRDLLWIDENSDERTAEIPVCGHCVPRHSSYPHPSAVPQGPCTTLRMLALPYADRPGYRDEWRP
jgi:hypothetical protein